MNRCGQYTELGLTATHETAWVHRGMIARDTLFVMPEGCESTDDGDGMKLDMDKDKLRVPNLRFTISPRSRLAGKEYPPLKLSCPG